MNEADIKGILSRDNVDGVDPFILLRGISKYVNNPEKQEIGRELVLRSLEKKDFFGGYSEILESLTRQVGLFPYLTKEDLSFRDFLAYEFHRPLGMEENFVFHRSQAEVYRMLMDGKNVIASAPTSFGKSRIIDAIISTNRYQNIVLVVPTIALIDETRRRLCVYDKKYKIITQVSQETDDRNIFVLTAERLISYSGLPKIDFFVIDEFYKIGALAEGEGKARTVALNQAFYQLYKGGGQYYLLGPNVQSVPEGLEEKFKCCFYSTEFSTVASDLIHISDWTRKSQIDRLISLAQNEIDGQTLIYCRSPNRVNDVVAALVDNEVFASRHDFSNAEKWISENFHPDWIFQKALEFGIGMHHGKLPRSLSQYSVRAFNDKKLKFLVCTSTLIEGVNTSAKNVIILDNILGKRRYDFFTFNNIKGRSGRMFRHFVGKVFCFHPPPQPELPLVDFPLYTQSENTPESLLVQLEENDLTQKSKERLKSVTEQNILPLEIIKMNSGIDPSKQIELAKSLNSLSYNNAIELCWSYIPTYQQIYKTFEFLWKYLIVIKSSRAVGSSAQLGVKTIALMRNNSVRERINSELNNKQYGAASVTEAVEKVLEFDRAWASFELPRALRAMSNIQNVIFKNKFGLSGNYIHFASQLESLFRNPVAMTLEEFGLPIQIMDKIERETRIGFPSELDPAIAMIRSLSPEQANLDSFETELFEDVKKHL